MKNKIILLLAFATMSFMSCKDETSNNSPSSSQTYVEPTPSCKPSTSKVRRLVKSNWSDIRSIIPSLL